MIENFIRNMPSKFSFSFRLRIAIGPVLLMRGPDNLGKIDAFFGHLVERRKLAQLLHHVDHLVGHVIDFVFRVEPAEAEPDGRMRQVVARAQAFNT